MFRLHNPAFTYMICINELSPYALTNDYHKIGLFKKKTGVKVILSEQKEAKQNVLLCYVIYCANFSLVFLWRIFVATETYITAIKGR